jgi:hypothetical protein
MGVFEKSRYRLVEGFKLEVRSSGEEAEQGRNGAERTANLLNLVSKLEVCAFIVIKLIVCSFCCCNCRVV